VPVLQNNKKPEQSLNSPLKGTRPAASQQAGRQICFTRGHWLGQPRVVGRSFAVCIVLAILICSACGQDQERKLMDRLLKPDMALQNDAQNKRFTSDGSASINKRASVGSFYIHQQTSSKNFSRTRDFTTSPFYSQAYRGGRSAYEASSQQTMANSQFAHANGHLSRVRGEPAIFRRREKPKVAQPEKRAAHDRSGPRVAEQEQVALVRPRRVHYFVIGSCNRMKLWRY